MVLCLVALAALAVSGAAMAQATIYGRMDVSYGVKQSTMGNGGLGWKQVGLMDGLSTSNAIGFDATDDIGGGMKARFVAETGLSPTNAQGMFGGMRTGNAGAQLDGYASSTTDLFDYGSLGGYTQASNRQTFVQLSGGFGTIRAGYQRTLGYEQATFNGYTFTGEGAVGGQVSHVFGLGAAGGTRSNSIEYQLPKMGAMNVAIQMGSTGGRESTEFGSAASNTATRRGTTKDARTSLQIKYEDGPLKAGITYTNYTSVASAIAQNCSTTSTAAANAYCTFGALGQLSGISTAASTNFTGDAEYNTNLTQLGGSYDFGMIKVGVTYNTGTFNRTAVTTSAAGTAPSVAAGSGVAAYDIRSQAISFSMPMGKASIYGGMGTASQASGSSIIHDFSTQQIAIDYAFSKRSKVYGLIGAAKDQAKINSNSSTASGYMTQTGVGILTTF